MNAYLRHLVNFAQVVNAGSITAAANREQVSPSTMSESVKIIEAYSGQPLLRRTRAGVELLGEGREIYEEASVILDALDRVGQLGQSPNFDGEVRLSVPVEIATSWLPKAVARISQDLPGVRLTVFAEDAVLDHAMHTRDLHIRVSGRSSTHGLHVLHDLPMTAVMVASVEQAETFDVHDADEVNTRRFMTGPAAKPADTLPLTNPDGRIAFSDVLEVSDIVTRLHFARQGLGLTCCIGATVADEIAAGTLARVLPDRFAVDLHLVIGTPRAGPKPRVAAVADILAACAPN